MRGCSSHFCLSRLRIHPHAGLCLAVVAGGLSTALAADGPVLSKPQSASSAVGGRIVRYVKLEQLSEASGGPWASMSEFNLFGTNGQNLPRTGWKASADSAEPQDPPDNALDGRRETLWHSRWNGTASPPPHTFVVDLGSAVEVDGFRYLPRQDGIKNGTIDRYRFYLSQDGRQWGAPVVQGDLSLLGTPTSEKTVRIGEPQPVNRPPSVGPLPMASMQIGETVSLQIQATDPEGDAVAFAATGLPEGLTVGPSTGVIAGMPTAEGRFKAIVKATDSRGATASVPLDIQVASIKVLPGMYRYFKLEQLTEVNGKPWGSVAELSLLDKDGQPLSKAGWTAAADSNAKTDLPSNAIDGRRETIWHTAWDGAAPPPPHSLTLDVGRPVSVSGFRCLPRQDGTLNGIIAKFRFFGSLDGKSWSPPLAEGDFRSFGPVAAEKTVRIGAAEGLKNASPVLTSPDPQVSSRGQSVRLAVRATDADGDALAFTATGLPPGLSISNDTGTITGAPSLSGSYQPVLRVSDPFGHEATLTFSWKVETPTGTPRTARYVRLEQLSEVNGNPWASMAEFNLVGIGGANLPRSYWLVSVDSAESGQLPRGAIDGSPDTLWQTPRSAASPSQPHWFRVDLGSPTEIRGFRYLPRQDGSLDGTFSRYRLYLSRDGREWGAPVLEGDLKGIGAPDAERTVMLP